jgi:hypothetical protein
VSHATQGVDPEATQGDSNMKKKKIADYISFKEQKITYKIFKVRLSGGGNLPPSPDSCLAPHNIFATYVNEFHDKSLKQQRKKESNLTFV